MTIPTEPPTVINESAVTPTASLVPEYGPSAHRLPFRRRHPVGAALLWVGGLGVCLGIALGGVQLADQLTAVTRTADVAYPTASVVDLVADGNVRVTAGPTGTIDVHRQSHAGFFARPTYSAALDADTLTVRHTCAESSWLSAVCSADLTVTTPPGTRVVVHTSAGTVQVIDVTGDLDLRTGYGDVNVDGAVGTVTAVTGSGSVAVAGKPEQVSATSSYGNVTVAGSRGTVTATSSTGNVRVDDTAGPVTARTSYGDVTVTNAHGAAASTDSGSVVVRGVTGNVEARTSYGDATVYSTGTGPVALDIHTDYGTTTIQAPTDPTALRSVTVFSSSGNVAYLAG